MSEYPPILIIVYDRYEHFKRCIAALQKCADAGYYSVYVASDGPRDARAQINVEKIRQYCKTVEGFAAFNVFERSENIGLLANSIKARDFLFEKDERLIVIEDDVIVGKYFLRYMVDGLNKYKDEKTVVGICSQLPHEFDQKFADPFFWSLRAPYGLGMWRASEAYIEQTLSPTPARYFQKLFSSREVMKRLFSCYPALLKPMVLIASGRFRAPDVEASVVMLEKSLLALYPATSLSNHEGNDGSGLHAPKDNHLQNRTISNKAVTSSLSLPMSQHLSIASQDFFRSQTLSNKLFFEIVYWSLRIMPKLSLVLFYLRSIKKKMQAPRLSS